jgi:NAD(P)-dependent dehydrogenase (short-subunit alcohol dehydrogenase family)
MKIDLHGAVALVTGGARGIGAAIGETLAANGARVALADMNETGAVTQAERIGGETLALGMDIRASAQIEDGVACVLKRWGRIDLLVNNAGVNTLDHRVDIDAFPIDEWNRIVRTDLDGVFLVSRAVVPSMRAQGGGRIVNTASIVGLVALRLQSAFNAAKAGVIHLTRAMALELATAGIAVNAVAPGSIRIEATQGLFYGPQAKFHDRATRLMQHIPLGRPGSSNEIAQAVLFLGSSAAAAINGHTLVVDGGWTAGFNPSAQTGHLEKLPSS